MPAQYPMAPPPPHYPQAHFYGVHETDLAFPLPRNMLRKSSGGSFHAFDTLASAGENLSSTADNVLLVAVDKGLIIYAVEGNKLRIVGRLGRLRGDVIGAKILPSTSRSDPLKHLRPLIALIVHGPAALIGELRPATSQPEVTESDPPASVNVMQAETTAVPGAPHQYQTTAEVYSLKDQTHVATLFRSIMVVPEIDFSGSVQEIPSPIGNLIIQAKGRFITLSSGTSGEVYIFEAPSKPTATAISFRCLGKVWTSIPSRKGRSYSSSSTSSDADYTYDGSPNHAATPDVPIVSLSHRWLAIVPPASSSRSTLHGKVDTKTLDHKPPGLKSHSPPSQPQVSCELDTPRGESMLNKVARDVTQEVIKGAKWVGDQGMQAWKHYWNKPSEANLTQGFGMHSPQMQAQQSFPPTHANDDRNRSSNQLTLISIMDLQKLSESQEAKSEVALHPVATFALPSGCSFVSLNPTGLSLLTASEKGDVQYIWDLMASIHSKTTQLLSAEKTMADQKPSVRQIARFTRMTVASITDVVWTEPTGERLVIVTDRGTVHIFDLPVNAFQWPPLRRVLRTGSASTPQPSSSPSNDSTELPNSAGAAFSAAVNMVSRAQPLLASIRGRPPNITSAIANFSNFNLTANAAAGAGAKGATALATGISKSVGAATGITVNTIRHLGENRIQIPGAPHTTGRGCVRWLGGQDRSLLAVVGNGVVRIHDVHQSSVITAGRRRPSVIGGKPVEIGIPADSITPSTSAASFWRPTNTPAPKHIKQPLHAIHPLSFAEIETTGPYQPFHTDHRVNLHIYTSSPTDDIHHLADPSVPWCFGEDIPCQQISSGAAIVGTEASELVEGEQMENVVRLEGEVGGDGARQVVVTTRRKKRNGGDGEDGIFEDADLVEWVDERV